MPTTRRPDRPPPAGSLVVVHGQTHDADVLSLIGHLDLSSVGRLVTQAGDAIQRGRSTIILDVAGLVFVDSAGLAGIVNVLRRAVRAGGGVILVHVGGELQRLLELTRLDRELAVAETLAGAEALVAGRGVAQQPSGPHASPPATTGTAG